MLEIMSTARPYGLVKISPRQATFEELVVDALSDPSTRESMLHMVLERLTEIAEQKKKEKNLG